MLELIRGHETREWEAAFQAKRYPNEFEADEEREKRGDIGNESLVRFEDIQNTWDRIGSNPYAKTTFEMETTISGAMNKAI